VRLNVYLEDLNVIEFKQSPAYLIEDLFADIGGTLGLWMGISVLTIMELIELLIQLVLLLFNSEKKHTGESSGKSEICLKYSALSKPSKSDLLL
jgi:uncharacterized membrane protein